MWNKCLKNMKPHPVNLREIGQWESASTRVEQANSVRSCPLSMNIFATICHGRNIPRSQALRSPNSQPCFMLFPMGWDGSEGRRMQFDSRNKYGTWVGKKSSWKNPKNASGKSEEHKWQTGGREKSSSTAAPSALVRGWSMRNCEFTWRAGQFCA